MRMRPVGDWDLFAVFLAGSRCREGSSPAIFSFFPSMIIATSPPLVSKARTS